MKSLIIGASGKIGKYYLQKKNKNLLFTYFKNKIHKGIRFNLLKDDINKIIKKYNITSVVLLSANSDPDYCKKNKKKSNELNVYKTKEIIKQFIDKNIYFIFFSSEFVFDGKKGNYNENSKTSPINLYGKQKKQIEIFIKKNAKNYSILRIAKTYGDKMNDNTLISSFLKISRIKKQIIYAATDQKFSPLFSKDLIKITLFFLKNKVKGVYNVGGPHSYSRYEIYERFNKLINENQKKFYKVALIKKKLSNFKFYEKRPKNVSFNVELIKKTINFNLVNIEKIFKKKYESFKRRQKSKK